MRAQRVGTATVLFSDLVGSSALRADLGEEAADALALAHEALLRRVVEVGNGRVVKGGGDGVMAVFDAASDAIGAAVAIQRAVVADNRERSDAVELLVRIGLAVGDVTFTDDDCFGRPVVEAARLEAAADGGAVLCTETVRALAGGRGGYEFTSVGSLELKGLPDPVPVSRVEWDVDLVSDISVPLPGPLVTARARGELFGRHDELSALTSALDETVGAGGVRGVLVVGEPGIGKTRLLAEFAERARVSGALVGYGVSDRELGVPFDSLRQALGRLLLSVPRDRAAGWMGRYSDDLVAIIEELQGTLGDVPVGHEVDRARVVSGFELTVASIGADQPFVLVLDDVHWAPQSTLLALRAVFNSPARTQVLVVAASRRDRGDWGEPFSGFVADADRSAVLARLEVGGLSDSEVTDMVTALGAGRSATGLADYTGGNPFFVRELCAIGPDDTPSSTSLLSVVDRRLGSLTPATRTVLEAAAVLGERFSVALVAMVLEASIDNIADAVAEAERAGVVTRQSELDVVQFGHAIVRDGLLEALRPSARRRLHRKAADVFGRSSSLADSLAGIGHRLECLEADRLEEALAETMEVAGRLEADGAHEDAAAILDRLSHRARGLLTPRQELEIELEVARHVTLFDPGPGNDEVVRLAHTALASGWEDLHARAALAFGGIVGPWYNARDHRGEDLVEQALTTTSDPATTARLLARRGFLLSFSPDIERRRAASSRAVELAREIGDQRLLIDCLGSGLPPVMNQPLATELLTAGDELRKIVDRTGDQTAAVHMHTAYVQGHGFLGPRRSLDEAWDRARHQFPANRPFIGPMDFVDAYRLLMAGDLDRAFASATAAFEATRGEGGGGIWHLVTTIVPVAWIHADLAAVAPHIDAAYQDQGGTPLRLFYALGLAATGRTEEAAGIFERTTPDQLDASYSTAAGSALSFPLAQGALALGDPGHVHLAAEWISALPNLAASATATFCGAHRLHSAMAHAFLGHIDLANDHFEQAHQIHREWESVPFLAHGLVEHADLLLTHDRPAAQALIAEALELADHSSLAPTQARAEHLAGRLARASLPPQTAPTHPPTPR